MFYHNLAGIQIIVFRKSNCSFYHKRNIISCERRRSGAAQQLSFSPPAGTDCAKLILTNEGEQRLYDIMTQAIMTHCQSLTRGNCLPSHCLCVPVISQNRNCPLSIIN